MLFSDVGGNEMLNIVSVQCSLMLNEMLNDVSVQFSLMLNEMLNNVSVQCSLIFNALVQVRLTFCRFCTRGG